MTATVANAKGATNETAARLCMYVQMCVALGFKERFRFCYFPVAMVNKPTP